MNLWQDKYKTNGLVHFQKESKQRDDYPSLLEATFQGCQFINISVVHWKFKILCYQSNTVKMSIIVDV